MVRKALVLVALAIPGLLLAGNVGGLYSFVVGQPASASQMNANFDALRHAIDDNANNAPKLTTSPDSDPTPADDVSNGHGVASKWVNQASGEVFMCIDNSAGAAVWISLSATSAQPTGPMAYSHYRVHVTATRRVADTRINELTFEWDGSFQTNAMTACDEGTIGGVGATITFSSTHKPCTDLEWTPWMAFDNDTTNGRSWIAVVEPPVWLAVELATPKLVTGYKIRSNLTDDEAAPKDFTLQGSHDGVNWTVVDARTNEPAWGDPEERTYIIP